MNVRIYVSFVIMISLLASGPLRAEQGGSLDLDGVKVKLKNIINLGPSKENENKFIEYLNEYLCSLKYGKNKPDENIIFDSARYVCFISDKDRRDRCRMMFLSAMEDLGTAGVEAKRICDGPDFPIASPDQAGHMRADFENMTLNYIESLLETGSYNLYNSLENRRRCEYLLNYEFVEYSYRAKCLKVMYMLPMMNTPGENEMINILDELMANKNGNADEIMFKKVVSSVELNIETRKTIGITNSIFCNLETFIQKSKAVGP